MNELLELEPHNVKALFLRGKAYYFKKEFTDAYNDFLHAVQIDPND